MASQKVVKFGVAQIKNPTPLFLKYIFRAVSFFSGLWALLAPAMTHITPETLADINKWLLIGNTIIHYAIKFFGWDWQPEDNYTRFSPTKNYRNMNGVFRGIGATDMVVEANGEPLSEPVQAQNLPAPFYADVYTGTSTFALCTTNTASTIKLDGDTDPITCEAFGGSHPDE